ncbi:RHS repeat domain-containing protein [Streptomyces tsukubensis]|uniref:RHS repeat domain-containing protein n=1 Tax=Streptomyces tsukubensis TaxID=83656 RepID=UPI00344FFC61
MPAPRRRSRFRSGPRVVAAIALTLSTVLTASTVQAATVYDDQGRPYRAEKPTFDDPAETTPIKAKPRAADATRKAAVTKLDPASWPTAGSTTADLTTGTKTIRPGGLPITITAPAAGIAGKAAARSSTPAAPPITGKVRIEVVDRARATAVGAAALLKVTQGDTAAALTAGTQSRAAATASTKARITVDYTSFAEGHGGDYGARLSLFQLPACALNAAPGSKACPQAAVPLRTVNNTEKRTLASDITVPAGKSAPLLAVAATPSSSQGSYDATPLTASASWNVSPSSGGFSWSHPMDTVPVPGGFQPEIGLSYSSQSADGKTAITNNQGSWIGESFGYEPGYIERQYKPCSDDGHKSSSELCWSHENATIMLNGSSGQLILDDTSGEWHMVSDAGWKIEKLTGAVNGDNDGEHWKVTADGTEYYFGVNRRTKAWTAGKPETESAWTVPVTGDDVGDECYKPAFADAWCQQAWRWNLDYAKDRNGNTISYFYDKELNAYARGGKTDVNGTTYTRGGHLQRIEYGQREGELYTVAAPARVLFTTAERCEKTADFDCDPAKWTAANTARWPDTPFDRYCAVGAKCTFSQATPSFFTRKKLTTVTTQMRTGTATYANVEAWHLRHLFTDNGDSSKTLWLSEIQHEGLAGGGSIKLPSVQLIGRKLDNRVDEIGNNLSPIKRFRLHTVTSESGAQLDVTYKPVECAVGSLPQPGASTKRCYPVVWAPPGYLDPITDWFHKYVVASVQHSDRTGQSDPMVTQYDYLDDAGWRKARPDGITDPKFLTWGQWQGYGKVRVTAGDGQNQTSRVEHTYLQGLHGDELPGGGTRTSTVTDSSGTAHPDHEDFTGFELEKAAYNGGKIASKTISTPWRHTTATQTRTWDGKKEVTTAGVTATERNRGFTKLPGDGKTPETPAWREALSENTLDTAKGTAGRVTEVNDRGDLSTTADDRCTRTEYADNPDLNLRNLPSRVETVSVACTVTPKRATQVISDVRTLYDGKKLGEAPTRGLATQSERLTAHDGTKAAYQITGTSTYDDDGRPLSQTDERVPADTTDPTKPIKATTTYTYTETNGLTTKNTVRNPAGHAVTTDLTPAWGQPLGRTDTNSRRVDYEYDALGRLDAVWQPDRLKAVNLPNIRYSYLIRQDATSAIKTEKIGNSGAYNPPEYQLFDSLLRPRQHQTEGPNGTRMMADVWYDGHGRIAKANTTYNALGAPSDNLVNTPDGEVGAQTLNQYDGMGRPVVEISAIAGHEQWRTTTSYDSTAEGDRVHTDPPQGGIPTTSITNEAGQLTELRRFESAAPVVSGPLGTHTSTTYTYRPAGQLATVTDDDNNVWTYEYDQLGRKTKATDPDAGTATTTYDTADRPTTTTDGRGKSVTTAYDLLSRPLTTHDGTAITDPKLTETKYDRAGALGYPYASYRYVSADKYFGSTTVRFDSFYRPTQQLFQVPDTEGALKGNFIYTTTYNADGTVKSTGLPGMGGLPQETLVTTYDDLQRPVTLTGNHSYVTRTAWTPTSQLSTLTLSTGAKQSEQHFFYEKGTDRLERQLVTVEGLGRAAKDVRASYDLSGNVLSVSDAANTSSASAIDVQCYAYDGQRRLTEIWTPEANATTAAGSGTVGMATPEYAGKTPTACTDAKPGVNPLGGPSPYWTSYSFDKIGNRSKEVRHDTGRDASKDIVRTYAYADANQNGTPKEAGDGGPHAVTKVSETTPTGQQDSHFAYDASGNTTQRKISGNTQTLQWNSEGKVGEITDPDDLTTPDVNESKSTTFLYDPQGNRLKRKDSSGTTVYLPGGTELHLPLTTGATPQGTRYYSHAGQAVAVRTAGKVSFLAADQHGTGDIAIDATTGAVTQRRLDPYGNERAGSAQPGAWPGQKGFVGGTIDADTGLTNIGARQYDSALGKFISVDPIIDVNDPQQMNGYSYANDNPTTYADPTGLLLACTGYDCPSKGPKKKPTTGGGSGGGGGSSGPSKETQKAQREVNNAQKAHNKAKQRVLNAAKELGQERLDQIGVTAAVDCIASGKLDACGDTVLELIKYRTGVKTVQLLVRNLSYSQFERNVGLLDDIIFGAKETYDASKKLDRAKDKLAAARAKDKKRSEEEDNCQISAHSCDESGEYYYRGVPKGHPKYDDALDGRAVPMGGHSDPGRHAGGNTASVFTSWTHDYEDVALDAANELGPGGIVLRIRRTDVPASIDTQIHGTDLERYEEMEHALRGVIEGAEVSIDRGPWRRPGL